MLFQFEKTTNYMDAERQFVTQICLNTGYPVSGILFFLPSVCASCRELLPFVCFESRHNRR